MTTYVYERTLPFDVLDDGELRDITTNYTHHYQAPDYNSWDSRDDYYGENYVEVNWVTLLGEEVFGDWAELEVLLLDEFIVDEGDY